jgi:hypothetical protein
VARPAGPGLPRWTTPSRLPTHADRPLSVRREPRRLLVRLDHRRPMVQSVVDHTGPLVQHRSDQSGQPVRNGWTNPPDQRRTGLARNECPWTRRAPTAQTSRSSRRSGTSRSIGARHWSNLLDHSRSRRVQTDPRPRTTSADNRRSLDQAPGPSCRRLGPTALGHGLDQARLVQKLGPAGQGPAVQQRGPRARGPRQGEPRSTALRLLGPHTRPRPAARTPARLGRHLTSTNSRS